MYGGAIMALAVLFASPENCGAAFSFMAAGGLTL